jgi:hypothetical protein
MWQWIAAAALAAAGGGLAQMMSDVSSPLNDYNYSEDRAGRTRVFARSEADFAKARIFFSEKKAGKWALPQPIAFSDARWSDSDPWLTPDGKTLYFVSTRPTASRPAKTDLDLWRARRTAGGGWGMPEHLGDVLNGPGPELGPELHDGRLYFNSVRKGGKGGLDIYVAGALPGGGFGAPEPLQGPFNTAASESDFTIGAAGRIALFWRSEGPRGILHYSRRTAGGWSEPRPLPETANIGPFNFTPSLSANGRTLTFASTRPRAGQAEGMADIYVVKPANIPN